MVRFPGSLGFLLDRQSAVRTVSFLSDREKFGTPVGSKKGGPLGREVPPGIPYPVEVRHLESAYFQKSLKDGGAKPEGVFGVDPDTVALKDSPPLLEAEGVGRRDHKLALILEMEMHVREEQSRIGQVLDHVSRDDQLKPPPEIHCFGIRSLHVETRGLHGRDPLLIDVDTQDVPGLLGQRGMEGLIMRVRESLLRAGTSDIEDHLPACHSQENG